MATLRDIKRRINSVKSTQQITKAMKMVAAAKLRRAQERLMNARPYAENLGKILAHIASQEQRETHPLLAVREVRNVCFVVITSDRGLCGSFNANVQRRTKNDFDILGEEIDGRLVTFGRKGSEFFTRRGYDIAEKHVNLMNELDFKHARMVSSFVQTHYLNGDFDKVLLYFNSFKSAGSQEVLVTQLLPVQPQAPDVDKYEPVDYLYEPSAEQILTDIIPRNLNIQIWRALLESFAAEQAARMIAMDSATENAQEMIHDLTLRYNKARQAAITTEISEIIGGAEALRG